jgi:hypothetical protein
MGAGGMGTGGSGGVVVPAACGVAGEASGDVELVVPPSINPGSFAVAEDCSRIYAFQGAAGRLYSCPYGGCDPSGLGALPQVAVDLMLDLAPLGDELVYASYQIGSSSFWAVGLDLAGPPQAWGSTVDPYGNRSLWRWGDRVVAYNNHSNSGGMHYGELQLLAATGPQSILAGKTGVFSYTFSPRTDLEGYVLEVALGGAANAAATLWRLDRTGATAAATKQVDFDIASGVSGLLALPEVLLLEHTMGDAHTLSTCYHGAPTVCATETPLPAAMTQGLTGEYLLAHGRLYAQRVSAGVGATVYCATADVGSGQCAWKQLGPTYDANSVVVRLVTSDAGHIYRRREVSAPTASAAIDRVAR